MSKLVIICFVTVCCVFVIKFVLDIVDEISKKVADKRILENSPQLEDIEASENDEEPIIDDSDVIQVAANIDDYEAKLSENITDYQTLEYIITDICGDRMQLAVHCERYEEALSLYSELPESYFLLKSEFYRYKVLYAQMDKQLDMLLKQFENKFDALLEQQETKRCGFHTKN